MLAIEGAIVTIDAMGCQRDIAQKVVDKKADYVLAHGAAWERDDRQGNAASWAIIYYIVTINGEDAMKIADMHTEVMRRWDLQQIHDPDFAGLRLLQRPINSVMDVGANAGQSIVSFRVTFPTASIASFEANPMLHASLAEVAGRVGGPVSVNRCGLSDANGSFTLHIPHVGDEAFLEEASIRKEYYDAPWVVQKYRERGGLRPSTLSRS